MHVVHVVADYTHPFHIWLFIGPPLFSVLTHVGTWLESRRKFRNTKVKFLTTVLFYRWVRILSICSSIWTVFLVSLKFLKLIRLEHFKVLWNPDPVVLLLHFLAAITRIPVLEIVVLTLVASPAIFRELKRLWFRFQSHLNLCLLPLLSPLILLLHVVLPSLDSTWLSSFPLFPLFFRFRIFLVLFRISLNI